MKGQFVGLFDGTELERPVLCDRCGEDEKTCGCEPLKPGERFIAPEKQSIRVRVEKRKRGKIVTVACGFCGSDKQLQDLLTKLKGHCGAGGTSTGDTVEIQGDHRGRIQTLLKGAGYKCQ